MEPWPIIKAINDMQSRHYWWVAYATLVLWSFLEQSQWQDNGGNTTRISLKNKMKRKKIKRHVRTGDTWTKWEYCLTTMSWQHNILYIKPRKKFKKGSAYAVEYNIFMDMNWVKAMQNRTMAKCGIYVITGFTRSKIRNSELDLYHVETIMQ